MSLTAYHAKYFAHDLTRRSVGGIDRLSMALFDASVDLNPHQIEAALFALESPLSKGVILADEVGLGKTIEAGIVLCQLWAERKRRLLVICPASLRKQWALELQEKFNLPARVLDSKSVQDDERKGTSSLAEQAILVMSFNYASSLREEIKAISWDMVVIDEAHKLRNAYRPSNKVGRAIRWSTDGSRKLLLTATPLQNSLLELYGLSTLIDEHLFGDINAFRSQYVNSGTSINDLRQRLSTFCKRTLRNQVTEFIRYTERRTITRPFSPSDDEHALYEAVSAFLQRADSYALPQRQRHLTSLILRKLLASSSLAIAGTLDTLRLRLEALRDGQAKSAPELISGIVDSEDMEGDLLDEILAEEQQEPEAVMPSSGVDSQKLRDEIDVLQLLASWARRIGVDSKTKTLLQALGIGFEQMEKTGAARKALIFTESRRTQEYLKSFLESNGYQGQVVAFNGTNSGPEFIAATFEHDTVRPVDGYAAPQLHTHAVVFNVTERNNGQTRALQERSLFQSQQYATTVYRSELAMKLQGLGYKIERGKHGQPEIKGYSQENLEASSPRRVQIKEHLQETGREGAGAAQVAAHRTRDSKEIHSPEEVLQQHRDLAARFVHQADRVVAMAREPRHEVQPEKTAQQSVTYSRNHVFERSAVQEERAILQAAIGRSMGQASYSQVRQEFEQRVARGEFRAIPGQIDEQRLSTQPLKWCGWNERSNE
jgi:conjugative relaxase-like TrwC/TraI family protein